MIRINDEIGREISNIIRGDLKDPRLSTITTVVSVETTTNLSQSKVYVSIMGDKEEKDKGLDALKNASGFIRKELASRINLRNTPELKFILDETLDQSMKIGSILKDIENND